MICLVASGLAADSKESQRSPLVVNNPFASRKAAPAATPAAVQPPVAQSSVAQPQVADSRVAELPADQPLSEQWSPAEPMRVAAPADADETTPIPSDGEIIDEEQPPVYRLPSVGAEREAEAETESETPQISVSGPVADVRPLPIESSPEMLRDMDDVLSHPFAVEPDETIDPRGAIPYTPAAEGLSAQLLPSVRKAYSLAQRGALYAAESEFIQVLRRIAQANDGAEGTDEHSKALAAGLRALDEADDFAPGGVQLEAEMNVGVIVSSHRTPALEGRTTPVLPQEAIALYHQFSQQQLARAAGSEQAGSMALYGLGKMQCRLANESDNALRHEQKAVTLFLAALDAGPGNHLAANEVGVLLTRGGHPSEAADMFKRVIDIAPNSTAYHNLAIVEQKLGQFDQANANEQYAQQLAAHDRAAGAVSRSKGVEWVSPQELARANSSQQPPQTQPQTPRGPSGPGSAGTVARWPQKLIPNAFRR